VTSIIRRSLPASSWILLILLCATSAFAALARPTITAGERMIVVSGITPRGSVILFGASHETRADSPPVPRTVRRTEVLVDTDGDGSVALDLGIPVPPIAIWIAVDVTTGAFSGGPLTVFPGAPAAPFSSAEFVRSNPGALNKIALPFAELAVVVVRPGVGAWQAYAAKHSALDENRGTTKQLQLDLASSIAPVGENKATLGTPKAGDVVAVIDPRGLNYAIVEVSR
jgi:hypothetical protein